MHQEEYKGHTITVDVFKRGKGWTWSYQIDDGSWRECRDRPLPNQEIVLREAVREAKLEIDRLNDNKT